MEKSTGAQKARNAERTSRLTECRHMLESCGHKIRATRACGRYAVSGGRFGQLAWSLM